MSVSLIALLQMLAAAGATSLIVVGLIVLARKYGQVKVVDAKDKAIEALRAEADAYKGELAIVRERSDRFHDELEKASQQVRDLNDELMEQMKRTDLTPVKELVVAVKSIAETSAKASMERHSHFSQVAEANAKLLMQIVRSLEAHEERAAERHEAILARLERAA